MYYVRTRETVLEIKNSGSGSYFLQAYWSAWKLQIIFTQRNQYRAQKISRTRKRRFRARCVHGCNCARNLQRPEHHTSVPPSRSVNSVKFSMQPFSYKINKKNLNTKK